MYSHRTFLRHAGRLVVAASLDDGVAAHDFLGLDERAMVTVPPFNTRPPGFRPSPTSTTFVLNFFFQASHCANIACISSGDGWCSDGLSEVDTGTGTSSCLSLLQLIDKEPPRIGHIGRSLWIGVRAGRLQRLRDRVPKTEGDSLGTSLEF